MDAQRINQIKKKTMIRETLEELSDKKKPGGALFEYQPQQHQ